MVRVVNVNGDGNITSCGDPCGVSGSDVSNYEDD